MTIHRADCLDCSWSYEDEDLVEVSDEMERHARKEIGHDVDLERAVATDGGIDRFTELPTPDRFFLQIDPVEIEMRPMGHDEVNFKSQFVPGGKFGFEISASYEYAGYDCKQHVCLDREGAEALYDALGNALESDRR